MVEAEFVLGGLETFLDTPARVLGKDRFIKVYRRSISVLELRTLQSDWLPRQKGISSSRSPPFGESQDGPVEPRPDPALALRAAIGAARSRGA